MTHRMKRDIILDGQLILKKGDGVTAVETPDGLSIRAVYSDIITDEEFFEECAIHGDFVMDEDLELQIDEDMLERFSQKQYGEYLCSKCGQRLIGNINSVGEKEDEEGYHWRSFCQTCWEEVENDSDTEIYNNYLEAEAFIYDERDDFLTEAFVGTDVYEDGWEIEVNFMGRILYYQTDLTERQKDIALEYIKRRFSDIELKYI